MKQLRSREMVRMLLDRGWYEYSQRGSHRNTLPKTRAIITKAGFPCPQVMTPKTFLENLNLEA